MQIPSSSSNVKDGIAYWEKTAADVNDVDEKFSNARDLGYLRLNYARVTSIAQLSKFDKEDNYKIQVQSNGKMSLALRNTEGNDEKVLDLSKYEEALDKLKQQFDPEGYAKEQKKKKNPFWAVSNKNPENYMVVILEPTGKNLFYYVEANKKGKSFNKAFLKLLEEQNIPYQEYYGDMYMNHFAQMAQKAMTGEQKTYSFETQPQYQQKAHVTKTNLPDNALKGFVASVGKGSVLDVYLQNAINTATANVGDNVVAVLKTDWVVDGLHIIAPQGSVIYGTLTEAHSARYGSRNGGVVIDFNKIIERW